MATTTIASGEFHYNSINYNPIDFVDGVPTEFLLLRLRQQGEEHFNNIDTADTELHVQGIDTQFWVHRDYLILQSPFFRDIYREARLDNSLISIKVPSPETFAPLLEYLYTGDDNKWYDTMNLDNFCGVCLNVRFLGLGEEAQAICNAYCQNEFIEDI